MAHDVDFNAAFGRLNLNPNPLHEAQEPYSLAQFARAIIERLPNHPRPDENYNWTRREVAILFLDLEDDAIEDVCRIPSDQQTHKVRSTAFAILEMKARIDELKENGILRGSTPSLLSFDDSLFDGNFRKLCFEKQLIAFLFHSLKAQDFEEAEQILRTFLQVMFWVEESFIPFVKTALSEARRDQMRSSSFISRVTAEYRKYVPKKVIDGRTITQINRCAVDALEAHIPFAKLVSSQQTDDDDEKEVDNLREKNQGGESDFGYFIDVYQGIWSSDVRLSFLPKNNRFLIKAFVNYFMKYLDTRSKLESEAARFVDQAKAKKGPEETVEAKANELVAEQQGMSDEERRTLLSAIHIHILRDQEAPEDAQMEVESSDTDLQKAITLLTKVLIDGKEKDALLASICTQIMCTEDPLGDGWWELTLINQILPHIQDKALRRKIFLDSADLYYSSGFDGIIPLSEEFDSFHFDEDLKSEILCSLITAFCIKSEHDEDFRETFIDAIKTHLFPLLKDEHKKKAAEKLDKPLLKDLADE